MLVRAILLCSIWMPFVPPAARISLRASQRDARQVEHIVIGIALDSHPAVNCRGAEDVIYASHDRVPCHRLRGGGGTGPLGWLMTATRNLNGLPAGLYRL